MEQRRRLRNLTMLQCAAFMVYLVSMPSVCEGRLRGQNDQEGIKMTVNDKTQSSLSSRSSSPSLDSHYDSSSENVMRYPSDSSDSSDGVEETFSPTSLFLPADCTGVSADGVLLHHDYSYILDPEADHSADVADWVGVAKSFEQAHFASRKGPEFSLKEISSCLEPNRPYLVTARVIVAPSGYFPHEEQQAEKSLCNRSKKYCVQMTTTNNGNSNDDSSDNDDAAGVPTWTEFPSHELEYNRAFTITTTVTFTDDDLSSPVIKLRGGPSTKYGRDALRTTSSIKVMDFTVRVPPATTFRDVYNPAELCRDLVPPNGNAELVGLSSYPFTTNNPFTHILVEQDRVSRNNYFAIKGRSHSNHMAGSDEQSWQSAGLSWDIPLSCLNQPSQAGTTYDLHADVRVRSDTSVVSDAIKRFFKGISMEFTIRAHIAHGDDHTSNVRQHHGQEVGDIEESGSNKVVSIVQQVVMKCKPSWDTWVSRDTQWNVPREFQDQNIVRYEVQLTTVNEYRVNYDVDNMSMVKADDNGNGFLSSYFSSMY